MDDLVVEPDEREGLFRLGGDDFIEGAGLLSSGKDLWDAVTADQPSPVEAGGAALGLSLDALGFLEDPLASLLGAGVGWLIEHVSFLREGLDMLAGDPEQIKAHARTWHNVSRRLHDVGQAHQDELSPLAGWEGRAADAYRNAGQQRAEVMHELARTADQLSGHIMTSAAAVATVRSLIRDLIADVVAEIIEWLVVAGISAAFTAGASVAPAIAGVVARCCSVASEIASMISRLLTVLSRTGSTVARLAGHADELARSLATAAAKAQVARVTAPGRWMRARAALGEKIPELSADHGTLREAVESAVKEPFIDTDIGGSRFEQIPIDRIDTGIPEIVRDLQVETVKQYSKADREWDEWPAVPTPAGGASVGPPEGCPAPPHRAPSR